jgi:gas vesicle protein
MSKKTKRFAIGALIVGAVGYVAGILTAPKSGKETRADISQMRDKGVAEAEKQLKKRSKTNEAIEGEIIDKANNARQKAREILSALHDGTADDKDLEKAVNDVSGAIKSLKKYLKK